jgi:hypothetical protein
MTPLEKRQTEDAEFERKRRRSLEYLAMEMLAAHHGMADWQRFRSHEPLAFLRAKLVIDGGPPELWLGLDWKGFDRDEVVCWFEWSAMGAMQRLVRTISVHELIRNEDDGLLRYCAGWLASEVGRASGVKTQITLRGNRAAYEWHEAHKHDPAPPAPRALPPQKIIGGSFCEFCKAKFSREQLAVFAETLPCGHAWGGACYELMVSNCEEQQ